MADRQIDLPRAAAATTAQLKNKHNNKNDNCVYMQFKPFSARKLKIIQIEDLIPNRS